MFIFYRHSEFYALINLPFSPPKWGAQLIFASASIKASTEAVIISVFAENP